MVHGTGEVAVAFTYAWWLTGDEGAAEAAVRGAFADASPQGASTDERLAFLLQSVRSCAIDRRTMCPASELALLHDTQGLPLEAAASVVQIDVRDARTELAHGRIEALLQTVRSEFAHPERLGGLAVGNPGDVAHARQCNSCAEVLRLLQQGRSELLALPGVPVPAELVDALTAGAAERVAEPLAEPDAVARAEPEPETESRTEPEPEAQPEAEPEAEPAEVDLARLATGARDAPADIIARVLVGIGVLIVLAAVVVWTINVIREAPDAPQITLAGGEPTQPAEPATQPPQPPQPTEPEPTAQPTEPRATQDAGEPAATEPPATPIPPDAVPPVDPTAFAVERTGLLVPGAATPGPSGLVIAAADPVRIAVEYRGATAGVPLSAVWTVDGEPYLDFTTTLTGERSTHVFAAPVPPEGWPVGVHQVVLASDGAVVGVVDFTVATS